MLFMSYLGFGQLEEFLIDINNARHRFQTTVD